MALCAFSGSAAAGKKAKEPAPRFNATTTGGEKFNNDSIKGKVVLLEFWTTWCGYCLEEAPMVDKLNEELGAKGLIVLTINVGESKKTVKKYLEQHPRKSRIVLTDDTNLAAMFAAKTYPIYVVIDRDGNVAALRTERQARMRCATWCPRADWKANLPTMTSSAERAVVCRKLAPRYCRAPGVCEPIAF